MQVKVQRLNSSFIKIDTDPGVMRELWEHFTFEVEGAKFMPAYKSGRWDGRIRLLDARTGKLYSGLYDKVQEFCKVAGYDCIPESTAYQDAPGSVDAINPDRFAEFLEGLNLHARGEKIVPRPYQLEAIYESISEKQKFLISPTASGKSMIIYCIIRWIQQLSDKRIVLIVPTTSLVSQMYTDFEDYSEFDDSWNVADNCHMVYSGKDRITKHQITITTWQSFAKFPDKYFKECFGVIGDEGHTFTAKTLTDIMEKLVNAEYRIGATGTLKDLKVHSMVIEGLFGPIRKVVSTKKLMDDGYVAGLDITVLRLKYPKADCAAMKKADYNTEIAFINSHSWRNSFIANLALELDGNTIVMYKNIAHGEAIYEIIKSKAHSRRKVFLVNGGTDTENRERIREITETETDAIIVASVGTFSTGVNIRNLHNLISASPTKSFIKVMQSIGRTLRKADNGARAFMIDIVDDFSTPKRDNFALKHGAERLKMYIAEQFKYKMVNVEVPDGK